MNAITQKLTYIVLFFVCSIVMVSSENLKLDPIPEDGWRELTTAELDVVQWGCSVDCPAAYMCGSSYSNLPCGFHTIVGYPFCLGDASTAFLTFDGCIEGDKTRCTRSLAAGSCYVYTDCVLNLAKTGCVATTGGVGSRYTCTSS